MSCFAYYKGPEFLQCKSDRSQRSRQMTNRETASCSGCDRQVRLFICKLSRTQSILNTPGLRQGTLDVLMQLLSTAHRQTAGDTDKAHYHRNNLGFDLLKRMPHDITLNVHG